MENGPADESSKSLTKHEKRQIVKQGLLSFLLVFVALWIVLPYFWGTTYRIEYYFYRLVVDVYDFDSAATSSPLLGPAVTQAMVESVRNPTHFTIRVRDVAGVTQEMINERIVNEDAWAAIVINSNATTSWLEAARGAGGLIDGEYWPNGAISLVFASARFYQVVLEYLNPFIEQLLTMPISMSNKKATGRFLSAANPGSLAALTRTQVAAIATPFGYQSIDLRPILDHQWSGAAPLEAGLIYFVIFAFHCTLFFFFSRMPFRMAAKSKGAQLPYTHEILLRFASSWLGYFLLSMWYSLINVAFQVPMNGNGHTGLNSQSGFMVFWMLNLLTMAALGLAMEAMISLLTIKFFPLFLILWIIVNISSSFFPIDLMEMFYRIGYAMPFWHSTTADKYIFWGARNRLGLNFGVLAAWVVLSTITVSLFSVLERRRAIKDAEASSKKEHEKGEKGEQNA